MNKLNNNARWRRTAFLRLRTLLNSLGSIFVVVGQQTGDHALRTTFLWTFPKIALSRAIRPALQTRNAVGHIACRIAQRCGGLCSGKPC